MYIQLAMARKENMKYIIDTTIAAAMDWPVTSRILLDEFGGILLHLHDEQIPAV